MKNFFVNITAQELYDGQGKKIITYPRAEVRYLPQSLISDVPKIVAGLSIPDCAKWSETAMEHAL